MNVANYLQHTADPATRNARYHELVKDYYEAVTGFYYKGWGESFHFAPFIGEETLTQAIAASERYLAVQAQINAGMNVLDVGCGMGGPARTIARLTGANITGITISPSQVTLGNRLTAEQGLCHRVTVRQMDAMDMEFAPDSFDVVYAIESACHMPNRAEFYKGCARVLKPGGTLAGWDWIATVDDQASARYLEPICTYFALPTLDSLSSIRSHLEGAGLAVHALDDLATTEHGNRHWWDVLKQQTQSPITRIASRLSKTLRMMRDSGDLLVKGGEAGEFSALGFFVAKKPNA